MYLEITLEVLWEDSCLPCSTDLMGVEWEVSVHTWGNLRNKVASGPRQATDNSSCHHSL